MASLLSEFTSSPLLSSPPITSRRGLSRFFSVSSGACGQARSFVGPDLSRCSALLHGWGQFEQRAGYERRAAVLFERAVRRSVGRSAEERRGAEARGWSLGAARSRVCRRLREGVARARVGAAAAAPLGRRARGV